MAKQEVKETNIEEKPVLKVNDFVPVEKESKSLPVLKRGEILVSEKDENGKEINSFITNQKTFDDFYSKNKKFSIKKK